MVVFNGPVFSEVEKDAFKITSNNTSSYHTHLRIDELHLSRSFDDEERNSACIAIPYDAKSKKRVAMTLVDLCTTFIKSVWPDQNCKLPLRKFVFEILRRSRVQYPVFQVALCYLARSRTYVTKFQKAHQGSYPPRLYCGRRILVAALQVASKFLQDRFYNAGVWSRISGLDLKSLQENELALMEALDWKLFISSDDYMESCRKLKISVDSAFSDQSMSCSSAALTPDSSPSSLRSISDIELPIQTPAILPKFGTDNTKTNGSMAKRLNNIREPVHHTGVTKWRPHDSKEPSNLPRNFVDLHTANMGSSPVVYIWEA